MKLIDKDKIAAELEKRRKSNSKNKLNLPAAFEDNYLLSLLDTLETKEVDLEKEIQQHINDCLDIKFPTTDIKLITKDVEYTARKFFELGLKTQKGK
jgi:hypothetical protein